MTVINKWFKILYECPQTTDPDIKECCFLLTQSGTSAPVMTIKHNTIGGLIIWSRTSQALFTGISAGLFVGGAAKCSLQILNYNSIKRVTIVDANTITIETVDDGDLDGHEFILKVWA
jgi:hypothetical protein